MYYADIPALDNIIHDLPSRNLPDTVLQQGENIIFKDGVIQQRSGLINFASSSLPFSSQITGISLYNLLKTLDRILVVFTTTDIYYYYKPTGTFKFLTRNHYAGTVTTSGTGNRTVTLSTSTYTPTGTWSSGSRKVTVSSATGLQIGMTVSGTGIASGSRIEKIDGSDIWLDLLTTAAGSGVSLTIKAEFSTSWNQRYLYKISFDSTDINSCTTWYAVQQIDSSTQLTLYEDGPTASGSTYCLRLCYAGDIDNIWSVTYPYDPDTDDRTLLATNGVDKIQKWTGTGNMTDLSAYTSYCENICSFGSKSYHHILCSNTYDALSTTHFRQNIDISDAGELHFKTGHYYELIDKEFAIKGIVPLRDYLAVYTTDSISLAQVTSSPTEPFTFSENVIRNVGTPSIRTVIDIGQAHIFWSGKSLFMFDGIQIKDIGIGNNQYIIKNVNNSYQHRSFAMHIPEYSLYCLFLPWQDSEYPNYCIVYNYSTQQWMYWQFNDIANVMMYMVAQGEYIKTYAPTLADLTTAALTWSALDMRWSDLIVNENFSRRIIADSNGYIYEYSDENVTDSGYDITSTITTKDYPLNKLQADFRLLETILQMRLKESDTGYYTATAYIRASVDAGRTWSSWITVPLDGNESYMEKKIYWNMMGKQVRFQINFTDPMALEALRIGFNSQYKDMKFDE